MSWWTSPTALQLRNLGRKLGVNRLLSKLGQTRYEAKFESALLQSMRPGDVVWDVGANIGFYTRQFADKVGDKGRVIAVEPSPTNAAKLRANCADLSNVQCLQLALGREPGVLSFTQGADEVGATSRIADSGQGQLKVEVCSGDFLVASGIPEPTILKIDVEGYEPEVLDGLGQTFAKHSIRIVGLEVHFGLLAARGLTHAPRELYLNLQKAGFSIIWLDASHMLATRAET